MTVRKEESGETARTSTSRADFGPRTRQILARRAAYRCSNPRCSALTIGPGAGPDEVTETGVAAHIFAAVPGGPRGAGGLSFEQRQAPANGIWLCHRCSRLVDNNEGDAYPASLLRSWRDLHEARTRIEQGGFARPLGWVHSIEVLEDLWADGPQSIRLSRCNLLLGINGVGKSSLVSLLIGLAHPERLIQRACGGQSVVVKLEWYDPQSRAALIRATGGELTYEIDGKCTPFASRPYRSIVVRHPRQFHFGHLDELAQALGADPWVIAGVIPRIESRVGGKIVESCLVNNRVHIRTRSFDRLRPLDCRASGGEQAAFFFELAIAMADLQSEAEPTLLVFDDAFQLADVATAEHVLNLMSRADRSFQSVVFQQSAIADVGQHWLVTRLIRTASGTRLQQDNATEDREGGAE